MDAATFTNPEYAKRSRLGRATHGISRRLEFWRRDREVLMLPRGLLAEVRRLAPSAVIIDDTAACPEVPFRWRGDLRQEQREACRAVSAGGGGVLVAPCGAGKTEMGLALVAAWRQPALWIVHTLDLADQALERARRLYDSPEGAYGSLGGGRETIGTHLTVATVQTLARRDLSALGRYFGTVVLDEAHHVPARTFNDVVQRFDARYRLGLTATPDRADGLGPAMLAVLGPVVAKLTVSDLAAAGRVLVPVVRQVPTTFEFAYTGDYAALLSALSTNAARNTLIVTSVAQEVRAGHLCLVLSERVEHCCLLAEALAAVAPDVQSAVLTGAVNQKTRAATMDAMRDGDIRVLFATKLADEGLDIPAVDRVFLAAGGRAAGRVQQQAGRAMRTCGGKTGAVVYDFVDARVGVLRAQAWARVRSVYRPLGARVTKEAAA